MPRIKRGPERKRGLHPHLVQELAQELRSAKQLGQPRIEETEFETKAVRVSVIWDKWDRVADLDRSDVILQAYEQVEGKAYRDRITLAIGLTIPEAQELGALPYRIEPAPSTDAKILDKCHEAMREIGASDLFASATPELWLATKEDAEAARELLRKRVPQAEWLLSWEFVERNH